MLHCSYFRRIDHIYHRKAIDILQEPACQQSKFFSFEKKMNFSALRKPEEFQRKSERRRRENKLNLSIYLNVIISLKKREFIFLES